MDNIEIQNMKKHKHLGLILEKDGRWKEHIKKMVTRASRRVDILRGLLQKLKRKMLEKLLYMSPIYTQYWSMAESYGVIAHKKRLIG